MTSGITEAMRAAGWNVRFTIGSYRTIFAGVYQSPRAPTVTFADVCAELALCFKFPYSNGEDVATENSENPWTNVAFALTEMPDGTIDGSFPSFVTKESLEETLLPGLSFDRLQPRRVNYHIVHHETTSCHLPVGSLEQHLKAQCARQLSNPSRLHHPSYLPCNKIVLDSRFSIVPLRRKRKAISQSQSPSKRSAGSASPRKPDDTLDDIDGYNDMLAPASMNIDMDTAKKRMADFRMAVISEGGRCAVSGQGEPWSLIQHIGPGVQACHIVPQHHYYLYPLPSSDDTPSQDSAHRLCEAWDKTWSTENGILLMKNLHELFDARLFSIHPTTLRIRAFVPYDVIEPYHGQKAKLPSTEQRMALQHHYDMCCIENMSAKRPALYQSSLDHSMRTSAASLDNTRGSTPLSRRTDLLATPNSEQLPSGDPSKRPQSTHDERQTENADDEYFSSENDQEARATKCRRREEYSDSYITPYNSRQFLANVNWELLGWRGQDMA